MRWPWSPRRIESAPTPAEIETIIDANVRLARALDPLAKGRLVDLTAELIVSKRWEAIRGFELDDEIRTTIAANAAIPIIELGMGTYRTVKSIVVRPGSASSTAVRSGHISGTFNDDRMATAGEAFPNSGPIAISWDSARYESKHPATGRNVVIHEFAHKIDMSDGYTDGIPPLRGAALDQWVDVLDDEFSHTDDRPSDEVLTPYAWTNRAEFFAVSTETFFCRPAQLAEAKPRLYRALANFYRQDPAAATATS